MSGKIIMLNGVSSAGKTSLAEAIQNNTSTTFYNFSIDVFIKMAGDKAIEEDFSRIVVESVQNFLAAVTALYNLERNVLVDVVCVNDGFEIFPDLVEALQGKNVLLVNVQCSIEELEAREKARGDRDIGLARWQYENAYKGIPYDVIVDTSIDSIEKCADRVITAFNNTNCWKGFSLLDARCYRKT